MCAGWYRKWNILFHTTYSPVNCMLWIFFPSWFITVKFLQNSKKKTNTYSLVSMWNLKFQACMETNFAVLASAKQLRMECFYVLVGSTTNWKQWVFSSINGTEIVCLTTHSMYLGYLVLSVLVSFFVALGQ